MVGVMAVMVTSLKSTYASTPWLSRLTLTPRQATVTHTSAGDSQTLIGKSGSVSVGSLFLSPGYWCTQCFVVPSKSLFPQSCESSVIKSHWPSKLSSLGVLIPFAESPGWEIFRGP